MHGAPPSLFSRSVFIGSGALLLAALWFAAKGLTGGRAITGARAFYLIALGGGTWVAWRAWWISYERRGFEAARESLRVLAVAGVAFFLMLPFFTDQAVGGTDGRWYGLMLADFIEQWRAGVWPVFTGQGEYAWNGGVHPFRSAPVFLHVAGMWDVLTFRSLSADALLHLTAISAALGGALGMYAAGATLVPTRRWIAAGMAALYVACPGVLYPLYVGDMYMTWLAIGGALPLAIYGNARALRTPDGRGFVALAVGLALTWMSHPPVAMLATLVTAALQSGRILFMETRPDFWRRALLAVLLLAGLSAYYFYGMSLLPGKTGAPHATIDATQLTGAAFALTAVVRGIFARRAAWLALLLPAAWLLWKTQPAWLWCGGGIVALATGLTWAGRGSERWDAHDRGVEILLASGLMSAAITQLVLGANFPARNEAALEIFRITSADWAKFFLPLSPSAYAPTDCQPGAGLWLALFAIGAGALVQRKLEVKLFFAVTLVFALMVVRVPLVSDFLVGTAPPFLQAVTSLPLVNRLLPVFAAVLAIGGVLALEDSRHPRVTLGLLAVAVGWSAVEARKLVQRGFTFTATRDVTADQWRPENAPLDRFAYDLEPLPAYFSHGKVDPRLEIRTLDQTHALLIGPDVTALRMEEKDHETRPLTEHVFEPTATDWRRLGEKIEVAPGERRLLRFEFEAGRDYAGWLILRSEHGYREYRLPLSGLALGFGSAPGASRVISLWNTGTTPEHYDPIFRRDAAEAKTGAEGSFGKLHVSRFDPSRAGARVDSLRPYRATVAMNAAGFVETGRAWLRGYDATVDGQPATAEESPQHLVMVPLTAGTHQVELRYTGTRGLWATLWISGLTWAGLLGVGAGNFRKRAGSADDLKRCRR